MSIPQTWSTSLSSLFAGVASATSPMAAPRSRQSFPGPAHGTVQTFALAPYLDMPSPRQTPALAVAAELSLASLCGAVLCCATLRCAMNSIQFLVKRDSRYMVMRLALAHALGAHLTALCAAHLTARCHFHMRTKSLHCRFNRQYPASHWAITTRY